MSAALGDPEFWALVAVLLLLAAVMGLAISYGPEPAAQEPGLDLDAADLVVKAEWGINLTEWNNLTDDGRAYYRDNVAQARAGEPRMTRP